MSHDQNFKNLLLDYPDLTLAFAAAAEAAAIGTARITPVRQEQMQERLGERFRALDVPLLVEWPDGRREALVFVLEEESDAQRFSIHRLAHYCLDLAELMKTDRGPGRHLPAPLQYRIVAFCLDLPTTRA